MKENNILNTMLFSCGRDRIILLDDFTEDNEDKACA